jgi:hypothetical protein
VFCSVYDFKLFLKEPQWFEESNAKCLIYAETLWVLYIVALLAGPIIVALGVSPLTVSITGGGIQNVFLVS